VATAAIPVSIRIKQALTAIQIAQFLLGLVLGYIYLFIAHDVPLYAPHMPGNSTTGGTDSHTEDGQRSIRTPYIERATSGIETQDITGHITQRYLLDSGKAFPLIVTTIYLIPLVYMFCRFYVQAYLARGK
jgi:hypothetical protein